VTFSAYDDYSTVTSRLANTTMGPRPEDAAAFWTGAMLTAGGRSMAWVDGSPITFAAFMETAPFPITGTGNNSNTCVMALYDGKAYFWMNNVCSDQYPAICRAKGELPRAALAGALLAGWLLCSRSPGRRRHCPAAGSALEPRSQHRLAPRSHRAQPAAAALAALAPGPEVPSPSPAPGQPAS
jgi:hypothetical protein